MDNFLLFAHHLADAAGAVIRPYFGQPLTVDAKADDSPVSIADREAEAAMRALIEQHYPDHGVYGEEHGQHHASRRYTWVIDPFDGTRAFLAGHKEWGTLIALCEDGVPVLGVLDQPVTGERWVGVKGEPTTYSVIARERSDRGNPDDSATTTTPWIATSPSAPRNDSILRTRPCSTLGAAEISSTSAHYFTPVQAKTFVALAEKCGQVIENGDCYAYGLLARGERDLVVDAGLKPYDILALVPIIEGAGGIVRGWDGQPVTLSHFANVLAAGDAGRHKEALAILAEAL